MSTLEEAFVAAEKAGLWIKGYSLHKFSGDGSFGVVFCVSMHRNRPIAEDKSPAEAIILAVERLNDPPPLSN